MSKQFLPNQYEFLGKAIYIAQNHPAADDANNGSPEAPFKTIAAAMTTLKMGDHVYIDEGIYREEIPLPVHGHYYVPNSQVHFHAVAGKKVYIKGSDVFEGGWQPMGAAVWQAKLPASLFEKDAYNPYRLALPLDVEEIVRPCSGDALPKTKGQLYVDDQAYRQVESTEQVRQLPASFAVAADGKTIIANFGNVRPENLIVELTMRKRCITPAFSGKVMIQTHGICIEHAAEPGPFCKDRPQSLRANAGASGVRVSKEFCFPGAAGAGCSLMPSQVSYTSTDDDTLVGSVMDDTHPVLWLNAESMDVTSRDGGRSWIPDDSSRMAFTKRTPGSFFLDERRNILTRHWIDHVHDEDAAAAFGELTHHTMFQFSRDGGNTWSTPRVIDDKKLYGMSISCLDDGTYIWPYYTMDERYPEDFHCRAGILIGKWNEDQSDIRWSEGGQVNCSLNESSGGLAEPSIAQFSDGRVIMFLRAGAKLPSRDTPGVTSTKLFSVSEDGGLTWPHPSPLCYEDGKYIYSPRSFHIAFRSIKNNRVYIAMNISDHPCLNCDPRTRLFLVEVEPDTLTAPREKLTLIEAAHPEHNELVRFSNFQLIQERQTGNPVLFMKLAASEYCTITQGYDVNLYRYEIFINTMHHRPRQNRARH